MAFCGYHGWHDWYLSTNLNSKLGKNLDTHLIKGLKIKGVPKNLKKQLSLLYMAISEELINLLEIKILA